MKKLPILIFIAILAAIAISQNDCTASTSASRSEALDTIHDTVYITEEYTSGEEFYNRYHPDSAKVTPPEGFTYYTDFVSSKYGRCNSQIIYALGLMLPKPSFPHSAQIAKWLIARRR